MALDWITRTWFRFNGAMLGLLLLTAAISDPRLGNDRLQMMFLAIPLGYLTLPLWSLALWIVSLIPVVGGPVIIAQRVYYALFCRFVVDPVPPRVWGSTR